MTFVRKHSGDSTRPIVAVYTCEFHGEIDVEVQRDESGEAPDSVSCPRTGYCRPDGLGICRNCAVMVMLYCQECPAVKCPCTATWTPVAVACRVRRVEAVKGAWEKPARSTYLDTREMGEGMDEEEFRAKRAKIWDEKRKEDVMAVKRGFW